MLSNAMSVADEEKETTVVITNSKPKCRNQHVHDHNWNLIVAFCHFCNSKVEFTITRHCKCCGSKLKKDSDGLTIERIMNKMASKYSKSLEQYMIDPYPPNEPHFVRIHHGLWLYEIELRFLALYVEMQQMDRKPFPAPVTVTKSGRKIKDGLDIEKLDDRFLVSSDLDSKEHHRQEKFYVSYNRDDVIIHVIKKHTEMLRVSVVWGNNHLR